MKKLKELMKAYFAPYENSGLVHGAPACSTDELAEAMVAASREALVAPREDPLQDVKDAAMDSLSSEPEPVAKKVAKKPAKAPAAE